MPSIGFPSERKSRKVEEGGEKERAFVLSGRAQLHLDSFIMHENGMKSPSDTWVDSGHQMG